MSESDYIQSEFQKRIENIVHDQDDVSRAARSAKVNDEAYDRLLGMIGGGDQEASRMPVSLSVSEKNELYHEILTMLRKSAPLEEIAKQAVYYIDNKLKTAAYAMEDGVDEPSGGSGPTRGKGSPIFRRVE